MASKNVETLRAAHESWNKRDFAGLVKNAAEGLVYTDHSRNVTLNSRDKFREWTEGWAKAFSDGRITNPEYIDAGDVVIAQFTVVGTNDGPFGSLKATGRKMSLPFCDSRSSLRSYAQSPGLRKRLGVSDETQADRFLAARVNRAYSAPFSC